MSLINHIKSTTTDESGSPSSGRTIAYIFITVLVASFVMGALGAYYEKKMVVDYAKDVLIGSASGGGLSLLATQLRAAWVNGKREETKASTTPTTPPPTTDTTTTTTTTTEETKGASA